MSQLLSKMISSIKLFEENIRGQKNSLKAYLSILGSLDQEDEKEMEFFFYADNKKDAENLSNDLKKLDYEIYGVEHSKNKAFSIIGRTQLMSVKEKNFKSWIEKMNELAFLNNCIFDGWGTLSKKN